MRITSRMMVDNLRQNINYNTENLANLQDQLSSGKRLRRPSDDPQAVNRALYLKTTLDQYDQYQRNVLSARGWLEATDTALAQISNVLNRARDVALRGATGTLDRDAQGALGREIDAYLQEALQAANADHEGKYLFAGFQTTTGASPFREDIATSSILYGGDSSVIRREIAPGIQVGINVTGDVAIGGNPVIKGGLQALLDIRDQLLNVGGVTQAQLGALTTALNDMPSVRSVVGANTQRVNGTEEALRDLQTNLTVQLSRAQDTDVAEVMTKLMMQQTVYQAALNIGARVIQPSLLDFLR